MKEKRKLYVKFLLENGEEYTDVYLRSLKENEPSFLERVAEGINISLRQLGPQNQLAIAFKGYLQNRFTSTPNREGLAFWSYDQKREFPEELK